MKCRIVLFVLNCLFVLGAQAQHYNQPNILLGQKDTTAKVDTSLSSETVFANEEIAKMDSLLNLWYVKSELSKHNSVLSSLKDDNTIYSNNDSMMAQRLSQIVTAVPLAYNERVKRFIELYALQRKRSCSVMLGLAQYYYPWMKEIFDKYDVPEELVYITIIESGLNATAVSPAGATGIWQFMYSTGKLYGLDVNTFIDDRRDPYKATDAAARHFRDLYNIFDDWGLAISAYNCGAGNVRKAIQRSGGKTDFWGVYRYLPKETQNYFPAFIGAYYMMTYHNLYGIEPAPISFPTNVDTVMVNKEIHFGQIAAVLHINIEEIKALNPQYKRNIIPAYTESFPLRLHSNDIIRFIALADSIHNYHYDDYFMPANVQPTAPTEQLAQKTVTTSTPNKYHYVKCGETLSKIASRYGLSLTQLKSMNKLRGNTIQVNQKLLVKSGVKITKPVPNSPSPTNSTETMAENAAKDSSRTITKTPEIKAPTQKPLVTYIVKKGDTLSAIANRYGSNPDIIAHYNQLANKNALKVGQKILIPHSK